MEKELSRLDKNNEIGAKRRSTLIVNALEERMENSTEKEGTISKDLFMHVLDTYQTLKTEQK